MRTYDIIDDTTGSVVGTQDCEDALAPVRQVGQSARLTHIDGAPAIQGEPLKLTEEERAALPPLVPAAANEPAVLGAAEEIPEGAGVTVTPITPAEPHIAASPTT